MKHSMKVQIVLMNKLKVILTYKGIYLKKKKLIPWEINIAALTATSNEKLGL